MADETQTGKITDNKAGSSTSSLKSLDPSTDRLFGILTHLSIFVLPIIGPLIFYLIIEDKKSNAYQNSRHALNFALSTTIYSIISGILVMILVGFILLAAIWIFVIVTAIIGAIKASQDEVYKYPLEIEFIKN